MFSPERAIALFLSLFLAACSSDRGGDTPSKSSLASTVKSQSGSEIYRAQCVRCHGKNGEGVKGKYNDALYGDWSIEKLTRYIDENMPDDDPAKCVGSDAAAVARYINDAFYSREARARNHPARVELVRLTNRQYLNTVADLIKHFTVADNPIGNERGLRGNFRKGRGFRGDNGGGSERMDRTIDFDYSERAPDGQLVGTNQFSLNWRGSIIAEETGEYEFIIKSPNGVRLWVNDEDKALIDAGVASGDLNEHKANIKLVSGRVYPLRLEFSRAAKDKSATIALWWKPPHGTQQLIPARNLSPARTTQTLVIATPFPPDDSSVGYERGVGVSKAWDEATTYAAIEVANHIARNLDRLSQSKASETNRIEKLESFCGEFVARAFRRPLTLEQKLLFVSSHFENSPKPEDAVKRVVLLTLKSPRFLYLGLDAGKLDDFEVASRLSFDLWDSLPNSDLWKLAEEGKLHTREQVAEQARHMLEDPRARAKVQYFLHQWVQINHVEDFTKDAKLYPSFTPDIVADLRTSLNLFLEDAVWNGSSDYRKLLLADYLFLNNRLAQFYGVSTNETDDFRKVDFDPRERCGVLTHPYLLAAFSYQKSTSPIHRGVFLTRNIVGRALKPPPMAVAFKDADFAPNLTMREKIAELTRPQACQTCHSVINPLGFSLENYDAVGRFRTHDNDRPVNAVSEYTTDEGEIIRLSGARDVAEFAAGSEHAQNAFIEQLFHQLVKQPMLAYGADVQNRLRQSFVESAFNVQRLIVEIATISALHGIEPSTAPTKKSGLAARSAN